MEDKQQSDNETIKEPKVTEIEGGGAIVDTSVMFVKEEQEETVKEAKNNGDDGEINDDLVGSVIFENETKPKRHKHKRKIRNQDAPHYTVDEDGSYNIDTSDVTYLEGLENPTPSIKKARGDHKQEKIEWWEIYKWADKMLARRKINKEVNKASTKIPVGIKKSVMLTWCIFFGWLGIHNFYAQNKKKGWTVVIFDVIVSIVINVPALYEIMGVFVGGGLGFVVFALWFTDLFGIIFDKYKYRISKEEFISNLNVETRAKLAQKYVNLDKSVFKKKEEARLNKKENKRKKKAEKQARKNKKKDDEYEIISHDMN